MIRKAKFPMENKSSLNFDDLGCFING